MKKFWCSWIVVACALGTNPAEAAFPRPAVGNKAMVASAHGEATDAGIAVLRRGGNAVDAAVATAFAVSVTLPYSAGIGGGGFALVREGKSGDISALDFRERAPLAASRDMYLDDQGQVRPGASVDGYLSVGVPGTVSGLYALHKKHGRLPWKDVVEPAIRLAQDGFLVSELYAKFFAWRRELLMQHPASRKVFTRDGEHPYAAGELFIQRDLARTLRRIQKDPNDFYRGEIAQAIVADMEKNGGLVTAQDLLAYQPTWREAVCGPYRGYDVCSMPPPSAGGVHIVQILNLVEPTDLSALGWHHPDALHLLIESMRIAYADRATHLGDPAFTKVPVKELTSRAYADKRRAEIDMKKARPSTEVKAADEATLATLAKESHDTSHLTCADADGNVVSLTFTVNYGFGSGVVVPGTGILLNDEMDDFSAAPGVPNAYGLIGAEANAIAPAKIPLSSMSPTIVEKDGVFVFATGSPGGSTIITTSLQVSMHIIDYGMNAAEAVAAPRLHHQWTPDKVRLEALGFDASTIEELERRGHTVESTRGWGNASAVVRRADGSLEGAADPRGEGTARGY